jgi:hypothetical protein
MQLQTHFTMPYRQVLLILMNTNIALDFQDFAIYIRILAVILPFCSFTQTIPNVVREHEQYVVLDTYSESYVLSKSRDNGLKNKRMNTCTYA